MSLVGFGNAGFRKMRFVFSIVKPVSLDENASNLKSWHHQK